MQSTKRSTAVSRVTPWSTPHDLKTQLARLWARGELLRPLVHGETGFPLALKLKGPSSAQLTAQFEAVRAWIARLTPLPHLRIEWREVRHPIMGNQRLPHTLWIDSLDAASTWLGTRADTACFQAILAETTVRQPALRPWLSDKPLHAIVLAEQWSRLLDVVNWIMQHPRPAIYLRQVDIPGIHSKFIETHRSVLSELFDLVLPSDAIASEYRGTSQFAARYGFLDKPTRIRFRILDPHLNVLPGTTHADMTLDANSFATLDFPIRRVFITENETNFLAFPPTAAAIVVFGAGYGWDALAQAHWLSRCALYYWGDIDTHGFAILEQLRGKFAHVTSFLMDQATLMAHQTFWGEEEKQQLHDLPRLNDAERALFDILRDNRIRQGLRLEQERVAYHWVQAAIEGLMREGTN